jgi:hypothetical protein
VATAISAKSSAVSAPNVVVCQIGGLIAEVRFSGFDA